MLTNLLASIITCLVTNTAETIHQPGLSWDYTIPVLTPGFDNRPQPRPSSKSIRTDVNEMRLLLIEVDGMKFTNILSSVLKWRSDEEYVQEQDPVPPPRWVLRPERTVVRTNFTDYGFATNGFMSGVLVITNNLTNLILFQTNLLQSEWDKSR
jgi:hypothetical protein